MIQEAHNKRILNLILQGKMLEGQYKYTILTEGNKMGKCPDP